jgi:hypothetical protein
MHVIADIDEPVADIAVDARIDGARVPRGRVAGKHQALHLTHRFRHDEIYRRRCAGGLLGGAGDAARLEVPVDAHEQEGDAEHDGENGRASLQSRARVGVEMR